MLSIAKLTSAKGKTLTNTQELWIIALMNIYPKEYTGK